MNCKRCGFPMLCLFTSYVCEWCENSGAIDKKGLHVAYVNLDKEKFVDGYYHYHAFCCVYQNSYEATINEVRLALFGKDPFHFNVNGFSVDLYFLANRNSDLNNSDRRYLLYETF